MSVDSRDRRVFRFQTTAKASADAHALAHDRLRRFDLIIDGVAMVFALMLLFGGYPLLGAFVAVIAVLSLLSSRFHPFQRALTTMRFRSMLGRTTEATLDDDGLRLENPLGSAFVPWSSMTVVKSNRETVAFFRGGLLVGYIPSLAFPSPAVQESVVTFARERIGGA
jgi:hypothetical protein